MKTSLFFLFFSVMLFSQSTNFIYEYRYVPDSTDKTHVEVEPMVLNVDKDGSLFFALNKFKSDSMQYAELQRGNPLVVPAENVKLYYKIRKTNGADAVEKFDHIGFNAYFESD